MFPLIRRSWEGSGRVYGYSKLGNELRNTTLVLPNRLDRQFEPAEPSMVWATDITYIRTHEGAVSGRPARSVLAPGGGLVNRGAHDPGRGDQRAAHGRMVTQADHRGDGAFE